MRSTPAGRISMPIEMLNTKRWHRKPRNGSMVLWRPPQVPTLVAPQPCEMTEDQRRRQDETVRILTEHLEGVCSTSH